jgi:hypothetical protein
MTDNPSDPFSNRRGDNRRTALKSGRIVFKDGSLECRIRNISDGGARLEFGTPQLLPHTFELHVAGMPARQCSLRWAKGNVIGVQFIAEES